MKSPKKDKPIDGPPSDLSSQDRIQLALHHLVEAIHYLDETEEHIASARVQMTIDMLITRFEIR